MLYFDKFLQDIYSLCYHIEFVLFSPNRLRLGPLIIIILLIETLYYMNKKNKIKIVVNGKLLTVNLKFSLKNLIEKLKTPINKVAIELNEEIVDKKN